jgi:hypothetical protein
MYFCHRRTQSWRRRAVKRGAKCCLKRGEKKAHTEAVARVMTNVITGEQRGIVLLQIRRPPECIYIYFVSVVCLPRPQQCDGVVTLTKVSPTLCMRAETTIFLRPRPSHSRGKKNYIATIIIQAAFVYLRAAQPIISYNIRSKATKMVLTAPGRVPGH